MKLASLKSGRDGRLVFVFRDLSRFLPADQVAPTLQVALDNLLIYWEESDHILGLQDEIEPADTDWGSILKAKLLLSLMM